MTLEELYRLDFRKVPDSRVTEIEKGIRERLKSLEGTLSPPQCSTKEFMNRGYNL